MSVLNTDELLAIALYESSCRASAVPNSHINVPYHRLHPSVRKTWRAEARKMMQEARDQGPY